VSRAARWCGSPTICRCSAARRRADPLPQSAAEAVLRDTRPDEVTPREALDLIYRLKGLVSA
jgi:hypothetical protein